MADGRNWDEEYAELDGLELALVDELAGLFEMLMTKVAETDASFAELPDAAKFTWLDAIMEGIERATILTVLAKHNATSGAS